MRYMFALLLGLSMNASGQSLSPQVLASSGGTGTAGGTTLDWTLGELVTETIEAGGVRLTQGFHQGNVVRVRLNARVLLEGPFSTTLGRMRDDLRAAGLVPLTEPYTALGYAHTGDGGGETTTSGVLSNTGADAIVDWVVIELRSAGDPGDVVASRSALIQSDGDVVDTDGTSAVRLQAPPGPWYIAVRHRNHLPIMTASPVMLSSTPVAIDLSDPGTPTYGIDARKPILTVQALWAGDVSRDGVLKYTGAGNDRDPILVNIGGTVPTNTTNGYFGEDVNMDGIVKYTGAANDRDPILVNIGGTVPTNTRPQQLP